MFSCVLLNNDSMIFLKNHFLEIIPSDWKWYGHHMTIQLGELDEDLKDLLGMDVELKITSLGISDKAIAVGVSGFYSKNKIPHITLAVNTKNGGKPKDSNLIPSDKWKEYDLKQKLIGKITEIYDK